MAPRLPCGSDRHGKKGARLSGIKLFPKAARALDGIVEREHLVRGMQRVDSLAEVEAELV